MEAFITVMSVTGFILWVLFFAWVVGTVAEYFGIRKGVC